MTFTFSPLHCFYATIIEGGAADRRRRPIFVLQLISCTISDKIKNIMAPGWIWHGITEHILIQRVIYLIYHVIYLNRSWYIGIFDTPSRDICWATTGHQWKMASKVDNGPQIMYSGVRNDFIFYLAIPATSAASQRLFSVAGSTITEKRSRLTDKNAENIRLLHSNQSMWWYTWMRYCHAAIKLSVVWLVLRLSSGKIYCALPQVVFRRVAVLQGAIESLWVHLAFRLTLSRVVFLRVEMVPFRLL